MLVKNLTPREFEVLQYICIGYTNKQIAQELKITTHTIKIHAAHIQKKFNVKSRAEIGYIAAKSTLI